MGYVMSLEHFVRQKVRNFDMRKVNSFENGVQEFLGKDYSMNNHCPKNFECK